MVSTRRRRENEGEDALVALEPTGKSKAASQDVGGGRGKGRGGQGARAETAVKPAPSAKPAPSRVTKRGATKRASSSQGVAETSESSQDDEIDEEEKHEGVEEERLPGQTSGSGRPAPGVLHEWDSDSEGEDVFAGGNLMAKLASSIRSALMARSGPGGGVGAKENDQGRKANNQSQTSKSGKGADDGYKDGDGEDMEEEVDAAVRIRWKPRVAVPDMPKNVRVAHRTTGITVEKEKGLAKQLKAPPREVQAKAERKSAPDTAGSKWYNLPATAIDDEMKTQLRLLRLRGAYDPKRFYKGFDVTKFPKHFQMGTVMDSPLDFYSNRMSKSQRGQTLTEELLRDAKLNMNRKKRYNKLQEKAQQGKRVKRRKTDLPRVSKSKPRPKH